MDIQTDALEALKNYMRLTESFVQDLANLDEAEPVDVVEASEEPTPVAIDPAEIEDIIFKLASHHEAEAGDYSLGVEMGMQMAADMLRNLLRRNKEEI